MAQRARLKKKIAAYGEFVSAASSFFRNCHGCQISLEQITRRNDKSMSDTSHTVGELHRGYLKRSGERILQLKEWIAAQNDEYERMQRELSTLAKLNDDAAIEKRSNLVKDMSLANAYVRTWEAEINLLETYGRNVRTELELLEAEYGGN